MSGSGTCMFALNAILRTREPTGRVAGVAPPLPPPPRFELFELEPPQAASAITPAMPAISRRERKGFTRSPVCGCRRGVVAAGSRSSVRHGRSMEDRSAVVADDLAGHVRGRGAHEPRD